MAGHAIRCQDLVKRYGDVAALDGLDLAVPHGAVFGFLGPNGAGKTTTVRLLTGLARPTAGRAEVVGFDVARAGVELRRRIGYLEQQPQFYGWMTGRELVSFAAELYGLRGPARRARVDEALTLTGLVEAAGRRVGGYSGGTRQRLGLAQALVGRPQVLFLDEPASALDPAGRRDILDIIAGLRGRATVFMSTHILSDVERVCDWVAIVNRGRLVTASTVAELQDRYAQPVFILEPEPGQAAAVAALVNGLQAQPWMAAVTLESGEIRVTVRDTAAAGRGIIAQAAAAGVGLVRLERARPNLEDIFLRLVGDGRTGAE